MKIVTLIAAFITFLASQVTTAWGEDIHKGNWISWRGPLQTGVSLESYKGSGELDPTPVWEDSIAGQGTPIVFKGRLYSWGYRGKGPDLEEVLQAREEKTGKIIWERATHDFLSDTVYDRYTIGAPAIDPETENIIVATTYGLVTCYSKDGNEVWRHSMIERFGRLTFPNGRAGAPVIDGNIVVIRCVTSYWGADGPARDRFFGFDKKTGEILWTSTPGVGGDLLKDTSMSTPYLETRQGKRVFYSGTGCGNMVCLNVNDGTPLWRSQVTVGGVNSSPVLHGDKLICIHGTENLDSTEMGRAFAIKLPTDYDNTGGVIDPEQKGAPLLPASAEAWRNPLAMFTSSPVLVGDKVFQLVATGSLYCLDANTGKPLWDLKLANEQLHASPAYADGKLYVPMAPGDFVVVDVSGSEGKVLQKIKLAGNCYGSPAICNGMVYVHTTERLYAFQIKNEGIIWVPAPTVETPTPGPASKLTCIPADVLLQAGESSAIKVLKTDANGNFVGEALDVKFAKFVPPTARVKSEMDASFEGNTLSASKDAKLSAGAWMAGSGDLKGVIRGRVVSNLPYTENFEGFELGETRPNGEKFSYPPLPWIGARLKWEVHEANGNKFLRNTLDSVLFQRSLAFIGRPDLSNYTVQADMMTDGSRRVKSVVGLINQRYIISLVGNANILEISSNHERVKHSVPFPISANQWYSLKTRVDVLKDGSGVVRGKAWIKGEPEPEPWTIEFTHKNVHKMGSPGFFGFSPQSQKSVFIDNIVVTQN